jgi:hypothetical protein
MLASLCQYVFSLVKKEGEKAELGAKSKRNMFA